MTDLELSKVHLNDGVRLRMIFINQKGGRLLPFELNEAIRKVLAAWLNLRGLRADDWLIPSRTRPGERASREQGRRHMSMLDVGSQLCPANAPLAAEVRPRDRSVAHASAERRGHLQECAFISASRTNGSGPTGQSPATPPCLLALFSIVTQLAARLTSRYRRRTATTARYSKLGPTFADAVADVRCAILAQAGFGDIPAPMPQKTPSR
ncbi:hypothetical protein [Methylobacterium trifolii]|uniref:hypothetical protein n=1 Tax=Methylobacterium trifolii TaxID=1003092 RepID=UPI001EDDCEE5|nr:hypothetical protein [Methylobacterium trifolii]